MDILTRRHAILDSIQARDLEPAKFHVTVQALASNARRQTMFIEALARLKAAVEAPSIVKSRAAELRQDFSRRLEDATRVSLRDGSYADDTPEPLKDLMHFGDLRGVAKAIRAAKPFLGKNKHADEVFAIYSEWVPIVDALESLKGKTTTTAAVRQEKRATEARARAAIPPSKLSAVVADAVKAMKPSLAMQYAEYMERAYDRLVAQFGEGLKGIANSGSYRFFDKSMRPILGAGLKLDNAKLKDAAERYADMVAEGWKDKIMAKAGELDEPQVKRMDGNTFRVTGKRFGQDVEIIQDMIVNVSVLGTLFNQWPARIYVGGKMVSESAYKRMAG